MTREPDRYDKIARDIFAQWERTRNAYPRDIAAALRQAESSALERAAQAFAESPATQHSGEAVAAILRYLKSPAAAPAAEPRKTKHTREEWTALADEARRGTEQGLAFLDAVERDGCMAQVASPSGPAAPAAMPERFFPGAAELMGEPPSEPVAPAVPCCPGCGSSESTVQEAGAAPPEFRLCKDCGARWQDPGRKAPVAPSLLPRVLAVLDAEYRRRGGDDGGGYVGALAAELRRYIATETDLMDARALLIELRHELLRVDGGPAESIAELPASLRRASTITRASAAIRALDAVVAREG